MTQPTTTTADTQTRTGVDQRGLAEPDATAPGTATIIGETAELDAADLSTRLINLERGTRSRWGC
jgi:hypothetical protein